MCNITFSSNVERILQKYFLSYLKYFQELYSDSGIFWEDIIIKNYVDESEKRYVEIIDLIEEKLSNLHISYIKNTAVIRWRSKILLVTFIDENNIRKIIDLEIR